ncbi:resolvase, n-terminal:recombinase, putative [Heliomicrobium modesticaldum Ice1]|uniref:Resolvase, n-terminal:recombinase, putative n=1 Tax=Heliobacterium modesticaldum (strain ATCC 51547 / Ice1) TaxID=498761 RepID=B0TD54_HELMI|nr:recombinase family protein [Heliomicrobium modesticaldum]ABZ82752.1 resolvase, n-terminal:recombinase, putative [Heliomicrobium modesticaldum Ice1]MCR4431586.1 recombinase family protein [Tepidanaerobacteraceae bacterium]
MKTSQNTVGGALAGELQPEAPRVIVINPAVQAQKDKLRIAAYARVSSDSDDQLNSFAAQVSHYTTLIRENENWELVDIYADEGVTGLRMDKREDFQRLLRDCRKGKIDRILTKSISRFSRNTRECLETIRELKSLGVTIYFEKEHIDTGEISNEMLLTFFSGNAQQESMSISGNMRWSYQHRMKNGKFITCKAPLGYRLQSGTLQIHEQEAEIVRYVFNSYLNGKSKDEIAAELTAQGVPTRDGKDRWHYSTIDYLLKNERYAGDALLQKRYTTAVLPFQKKRNKGEKDKYYVKYSHPAIISRDIFERAQELNQSRNIPTMSKRSMYPLSKRIRCGECGSLFKRKTCNGKTYWVCRNHNKGKSNCTVTQIPEPEIYGAFLRLYHKLKLNYDKILSPMLDQLQALKRHRNLSNLQVVELNRQIAELTERNHVLNGLKSKGIIDSALFISQTDELSRKIRALKAEKNKLMEKDEDDSAITETRSLIEILEDGPERLSGFDETLFDSIVELVTAESGERLKFKLINGLELAEPIERTVR